MMDVLHRANHTISKHKFMILQQHTTKSQEGEKLSPPYQEHSIFSLARHCPLYSFQPWWHVHRYWYYRLPIPWQDSWVHGALTWDGISRGNDYYFCCYEFGNGMVVVLVREEEEGHRLLDQSHVLEVPFFASVSIFLPLPSMMRSLQYQRAGCRFPSVHGFVLEFSLHWQKPSREGIYPWLGQC